VVSVGCDQPAADGDTFVCTHAADKYQHGDADCNLHRHPNTNDDRDSVTDEHCHADAHSDRYRHAGTNRHTRAGANRFAYPNADRHAVADR
jgi:hypothetical protein